MSKKRPPSTFRKATDAMFARMAADYLLTHPNATVAELAESLKVDEKDIRRITKNGSLDAVLDKRLNAMSNAAGVDLAAVLADSAKVRRGVMAMSASAIRALHSVVEAGAEAAARGWIDEDGRPLTTWIDSQGMPRLGVPDRKTWLSAATTLGRIGAIMLRLHEAKSLGVAEVASEDLEDKPRGEIIMRFDGFDPAATVRRFDNLGEEEPAEEPAEENAA